jgi:hypothetical protein
MTLDSDEEKSKNMITFQSKIILEFIRQSNMIECLVPASIVHALYTCLDRWGLSKNTCDKIVKKLCEHCKSGKMEERSPNEFGFR